MESGRGSGSGSEIRPAAGIFRSIVAAFDGSPSSRRAVLVACALASELGGEAHVVVVVVPRSRAETPDEEAEELARESDQLVSDAISLGAEQHQDLTAAVHVLVDEDPSAATGDLVVQRAFDLIVVGAHGRDRVMHHGIGRALENLLSRLVCPVLVV